MFSLKQRFKDERRPLTLEDDVLRTRIRYAAVAESARHRTVVDPLEASCTTKAKRPRV